MRAKNTTKLFISMLFALYSSGCFAQKLQIKNLKKIELITYGAWIDGYHKKVEVVLEGRVWKSYQTRLFNDGPSRGLKRVYDSSRTFLMDVDEKLLKQFIGLATKPDSVIHDKLFNINTVKLIAQIDSNTASQIKYGEIKLQPSFDWRNKFINAVRSKKVVSNALYNVLHPMLRDDRSHYYIMITDKFNKVDTISADAQNELYYLPWRIKDKVSYNPNITKLFEYIGGNYSFEQKEQYHLHFQIVSELYYYNTFKSQLDWARFKAEQPDLYRQVSKTLIPLKFSNYNQGTFKYEMGFNGFFQSALLPSFIELSCGFSSAHSTTIPLNNEKRLVSWYKNGCFLFDFMKSNPHAVMTFSSSLQDERLAEITKRYPEIAKFDRMQLRQFVISEGKDYANSSLWLLLPNDNIILLRYNGRLADNYQYKFDLIPAKRYERSAKNVCIVFNKYGKKIGGTEEPFEVKRKYL